jgi:hypothetical protein
MVMKIFQALGFPWVRDFLIGYPRSMKFRDLQGNLMWEKLFITIFEFIGQFFFQNYVFAIQEVFSELGIRVFLDNSCFTNLR